MSPNLISPRDASAPTQAPEVPTDDRPADLAEVATAPTGADPEAPGGDRAGGDAANGNGEAPENETPENETPENETPEIQAGDIEARGPKSAVPEPESLAQSSAFATRLQRRIAPALPATPVPEADPGESASSDLAVAEQPAGDRPNASPQSATDAPADPPAEPPQRRLGWLPGALVSLVSLAAIAGAGFAIARNVPAPGSADEVLVGPIVPGERLAGDRLAAAAQRLAAYQPSGGNTSIHAWARQAKVPVFMYHDIVPEKEVFFDVTPEELRSHFEHLQAIGATPISLDRLVQHLHAGLPLPDKPVLLTFDDGYGGHYTHVYPLLKEFGYPAAFSVYTKGVGDNTGRLHASWDEWREMAADPLVTITSHSVTHPLDLRELSDDDLWSELAESKRILETELGIPIRYFTYPVGHYDARVARMTQAAGYDAALTMDDTENRYAGESESLLAVDRIGQSQLLSLAETAWGGMPMPRLDGAFDFKAPVVRWDAEIDGTEFAFASGGRPVTLHADSRYQVSEIQADSAAIAAVDGAFFSMKYLDSNVIIGPVLSQSTGEFFPGNPGENLKLAGRPLVMVSDRAVRFVPFEPERHNTREGIEAELPGLADAFVGAAWLVRDGSPQDYASFGDLFDFDALRHRAFWGVDRQGQPVVGVSLEPIGSVALGEKLWKAGLWDAVMLDSGASTSLSYRGELQVRYEPRPVPHAVGLVPPPDLATVMAY